jgi:hypothetical protein
MLCVTLPQPMALLFVLEFPFDSATDAGESCDRSRLAPLAYDMRVGIVSGRRRGARHGAARLRRRRARYAGIAMEIGIEPAARHAADLGITPVLIAPPAARATPTWRNAPGHSRLACADWVNLSAMPGHPTRKAWMAGTSSAKTRGACHRAADPLALWPGHDRRKWITSCCWGSGRPGSCPPRTD